MLFQKTIYENRQGSETDIVQSQVHAVIQCLKREINWRDFEILSYFYYTYNSGKVLKICTLIFQFMLKSILKSFN